MLEPIKDNWTIVLVGNWNTSIFSPPWLDKFIFEDPNLLFEYSVVTGLPMRITASEVRLIPSIDRVIFNPVDLGDDCLKRMELFACRLLQTLEHTPVTATGINFGFKYEGDDVDTIISRLFASSDDQVYSDMGMPLRERTFIRSLDIEDWVLNLKAGVKGSRLQFDFNFHSTTENAASSKRKIEGKILELKNKSVKILNDVYNLQRAT